MRASGLGYLSIWPHPRSHHKHTLVFLQNGVRLVLVDQRRSPYVPAELSIAEPEGLTIVPGDVVRADVWWWRRWRRQRVRAMLAGGRNMCV